MDFHETSIPGLLELRPRSRRDERGRFVKIFQQELFEVRGISFRLAEAYYTVSHPGVLRGMHFQAPPHDHDKIVHCLAGEVIDVIVDLRQDSPQYGRHLAFNLRCEEGHGLFVPRGCAHGFYVPGSQPAIMTYQVSTVWAPESDRGVRWDSIGYDWPDPNPIVSARDRTLPALAELPTPFVAGRGA